MRRARSISRLGFAALLVAAGPLLPSGAVAQLCPPAAELATSANWTVLGDGTPGSVTQGLLQAALDAGGAIRFDVGSSPTTLVLTSELTVTRATILDGGGLVTLSGGGSTRILRITNPDNNFYTVTLQNLGLVDGATASSSGAAVYKASGGPWQAIDLELVGVTARDNTAIAVAQDDGGGALYATGLNAIRIHDSTFENNRGSNGGAIYSLGSKSLHVTDSELLSNRATGFGANPGNGGNGGAIGVDGADRQVEICNTRFVDNRANALGGAFFSVVYDDTSTSSFRYVTFQANRSTSDDHLAGAVYLQGGPFSIRQSTFRSNQANGAGALFLGPGAWGDITNSTFYDNLARQSLGGALSINTDEAVAITNSTFSQNHAPGEVAFSGGINNDPANQLTLRNTLLANNTGGNIWNPWNIRYPAAVDGGGNLQWPRYRPSGQEETRATPTSQWADPLLGAPASHGGPTQTIALRQDSPAIGAGVTSGAPSVDQRGALREPPYDSGAFEADLLSDDFESGGLGAWSGVVP